MIGASLPGIKGILRHRLLVCEVVLLHMLSAGPAISRLLLMVCFHTHFASMATS